MGIVETKLIGLGAGWVDKLSQGVVGGFLKKRREDSKEITDLLHLEPDDLAKLYIEPDLQPYNPADSQDDELDEEDSVFRIPSWEWLDKFLVKPKKKDGRHVAFILSDAGMGKTSLLAMLKLSSISIPRTWPGMTFKLLKLGKTTLDDIKGSDESVRTVLLLDSLDEDPEAFGRIEERLQDILKATTGFRQVIITCRTQFFPLQNSYESAGARIKIAGFTCKVIFLALFSEDQIDSYLAKLYSKGTAQVKRAKKLILNMKSLRMRPMLLAHVEDLMAKRAKIEVKQWTPFTTHGALVEAWLDREERKGSVKAEELRSASHIMAIHLQKGEGGLRSITKEDLSSLLAREDVPDAIRRIEDFGGRSLLNRNSDGEYRFAHYSIQEFLVVDHMARHPEKMAGYSGEIRFSDELVAFLKSWMNDHPTGWRANLTRADLTDANLTDANLEGADLTSANLTGANLTGAYLASANLTDTNLTNANLSSANLIGAYLAGTLLANLDLSEAKGLVTVNHLGPSAIDANTIERSKGNIPAAFLKGCGP